MKIVIAEDEQHTRAELRYLLEKLEPEASIFEARDGNEALALILDKEPDVAFLDINMPSKTGLTVATKLVEMASKSLIVFATAYDEHALKAFDLAALDYLLKPYRESRLKETLMRLSLALGHQEQHETLRENVRSFVFEQSLASLDKLWAAKGEGVGKLLNYNDILWFVANDKKLMVETQLGERLQVRYTMTELEEKLSQRGFFRSHKSYLINLNHVKEVEPWFSGTFVIRMSNQQTVPLSRQYAKQLKEQLGWF